LEDNKNVIESFVDESGKFFKPEEIFSDGEHKYYAHSRNHEVSKISLNSERPTRKRGLKTFTSAKSFCHYVNKHKLADETVIIADEDSNQIKAIINDHGVNTPSWNDFTAILKIKFSSQFIKWVGSTHDQKGSYFGQEEFADFLEDNRSDFMCGKIEDSEDENVTALELSNIITNLQKTSQEKFTSKMDPVSGKVNFSFENEEVGRGNVEIPRQFIVAIPVYRSGDLFKITIRLRHRISGGSAKFYYIIDELEDIQKRAFDMVCDRIKIGMHEDNEKEDFDGTDLEVYQGII